MLNKFEFEVILQRIDEELEKGEYDEKNGINVFDFLMKVKRLVKKEGISLKLILRELWPFTKGVFRTILLLGLDKGKSWNNLCRLLKKNFIS